MLTTEVCTAPTVAKAVKVTCSEKCLPYPRSRTDLHPSITEIRLPWGYAHQHLYFSCLVYPTLFLTAESRSFALGFFSSAGIKLA